MNHESRLPEFLARGLAALFPFPCLGCGAPLPWGEDTMGLCPACHRRLPEPHPAPCPRCGRPLPTVAAACGECLLHPPPWEELFVLHPYREPLPAVIRALKFRRLEFLAADLGSALAERYGGSTRTRVDLVVPVPLAWPRLLVRGFNQAALLARAFARHAELPTARCLHRRFRPRQARLGLRERRRNLRGSFFAPSQRVRGRRILLVDDVTTTGSTLVAATLALRRGGARSVMAAVVARTPRHGE